jgi:molybdopterin-guanine dinucleotide biosynthesis protein B
MRAIGVIGWSGAGKTTLIVAMLPLLRAAGLTVSTIKHAHHGFDMDRPGKDSFRHREAGAREIMVSTGTRWALLHEVAGAAPSVPDLLARMLPVDLVLIEGFRDHPYPKLEVYRPALGKPALWPERTDVAAVAADPASVACDRPVLPLNRPDGVVDWLMHFLEKLGPYAAGP